MTSKMKFTNADGKTFDLRLNLGVARRIERYDFSEITTDKISLLSGVEKLMAALSNDYVLFGLIYAICEPQAAVAYPDMDEDARQELFFTALNGETKEAAKEAFWEGLQDFFPLQATSLAKAKAVANELQKVSLAELDRAKTLMVKTAKQTLRKLLTEAQETAGESSSE